eukprot:TRINITY_DN14455_c0_g1_i1.p1 TRINITY_DN14455_c0_g1~~TRINITY_DN14455_c0_g1_i1.p1  ORF type:complete len:168 (-),score=28.16 TRINITY_DN14455_c0_g1_i1:38-481(-)
MGAVLSGLAAAAEAIKAGALWLWDLVKSAFTSCLNAISQLLDGIKVCFGYHKDVETLVQGSDGAEIETSTGVKVTCTSGAVKVQIREKLVVDINVQKVFNDLGDKVKKVGDYLAVGDANNVNATIAEIEQESTRLNRDFRLSAAASV